jgi:ubiquinone/menaquinone biosynthesis C-methylase UbiE
MTAPIDYDTLAVDYARHRRVHPGVLRSLTVGLDARAVVLEVGCGTGNYIGAIQDLIACSSWGVDPAGEMLTKAATRFTAVRLARGTAESLGFHAQRFDLVFSVDVIHHVVRRTSFLHEAWRVLRPGGRLCTVTDSEAIIRRRQPLSTYFPETVAVDLDRYPRIEDLVHGVREVGFVDVEEVLSEFAYELRDAGAYRARTFSSLRLIPEDAFRQGLIRMEQDLRRGPIACTARYALVWATKP